MKGNWGVRHSVVQWRWCPSIRRWPATREAGKLTRSKPMSSGVRFLGSEGGVLTGVGLSTASAIGRASSMVTTWPKGRWRLLTSRRGAVCQWGPHGGSGWAGGRSEATHDGEARGGCDCGAIEPHHNTRMRPLSGQRWRTRTTTSGAGGTATYHRPSVHMEVGMEAAEWGEAARRSK
jgi:hypothetical protein